MTPLDGRPRVALGVLLAGGLLGALAVAAVIHTPHRSPVAAPSVVRPVPGAARLTPRPRAFVVAPAPRREAVPLASNPRPLPRRINSPVSTPSPVEPVNPAAVDSGPFIEKPSQQEMPEIRLLDRTALQAPGSVLLLEGPGGRFRLDVRGPVSSMVVRPGAYRYAFYSPAFQITGRPDQDGTLTCRRFRLYEIPIIDGDDIETRHQDLGDD
jgi:hypothetical protein